MLLCDIGNTSYHFYDGVTQHKVAVADFDPASMTEKLFFINVNPNVAPLLARLPQWVDLGLHVRKERYYETMGIDRIVACAAVDEGLIIDAGSAITVDLMRGGIHKGGFIYPGIEAMASCFKRVSTRLDYAFNFDLNLDTMPKNSQDAITYGFLAPLHAEVMRHDAPLILTGGDAPRLLPFFPQATHDALLLFKGMQKIIEEGGLC